MPIAIILILLVALSFPRIAIFIIWLTSSWFSGASVDALLGILAFLFMPYTLLWYCAVMNWYGGVWGFWQMVFLAIAILADISSMFYSGRYYSSYYSEE